jgi:glycosyltransferase involved in cell wall biosynthesis
VREVTTISVVIGTRNQRHILEAVLQSYCAQTVPPEAFELVLADSASDDGTSEMCAVKAWPFRLRHLALGHGSKAVARNIAIREAEGPLVLLTDADVIADAALIERHLAVHAAQAGRVVVGRQILVDRVDQVGGPGRDALGGHDGGGDRLSWRELVTGNASLARDTLVTAGGFDETFVGYGYEDYELGYRLAARGIPIVYEPTAINWHCHPVRFEDDVVRKHEAGGAAVLFARMHPSVALRTELGIHPLNRALWRGVGRVGGLHAAGVANAHASNWRGRLARWFLLEEAFQRGVREALAR